MTTLSTPIEPFERWIDDDLLEGRRLFRPLVYSLQHRVLPGFLFAEHPHPEIQRVFGPGHPPLDYFWVRSSMSCEDEWPEGATDSEALYQYMSDFTSETLADTFAHPQFLICLVTMPKPVTAGEASFVALCRPHGGAGGSTSAPSKSRYFTVERTVEPSLYCFCEWTPAGKHLNLGQVGALSKAAFLQRVHEQIALDAGAAGPLEGPSVGFGYCVETEDIEALGAVFANWAGTKPPRPSEGMGTQEIHFDSSWLSFYGFLDTRSNGPDTVVITGSMTGDIAFVRPKLEALRDAFDRSGLRVRSAECEGCDADGNPITDEVELA